VGAEHASKKELAELKRAFPNMAVTPWTFLPRAMFLKRRCARLWSCKLSVSWRRSSTTYLPPTSPQRRTCLARAVTATSASQKHLSLNETRLKKLRVKKLRVKKLRVKKLRVKKPRAGSGPAATSRSTRAGTRQSCPSRSWGWRLARIPERGVRRLVRVARQGRRGRERVWCWQSPDLALWVLARDVRAAPGGGQRVKTVGPLS
jgi:hypothetical protein